jgi:hypothetical protein
MKSLPKKSNKKSQTWNEKIVYDNFTNCDHYFEFIGTDCMCKKCKTGVMGVLEINDGKIML